MGFPVSCKLYSSSRLLFSHEQLNWHQNQDDDAAKVNVLLNNEKVAETKKEFIDYVKSLDNMESSIKFEILSKFDLLDPKTKERVSVILNGVGRYLLSL